MPLTVASPRPVPAVRVLRREERLEKMAAHRFRDPGSRIFDGEQDVRPRLSSLVQPSELMVADEILGPQRQRAPSGHGIPGVHSEVHEHLEQLRAVAHDGPEVRRPVLPDADVPGERSSLATAATSRIK